MSEQNLFQRLTKLFYSGPSIKRKVRSIGKSDKGLGSSIDHFKKSHSDIYNSTLSAYGSFDRMARYSDFSEMESTPEIASALDIYAEETVAPDANGNSTSLTLDGIVDSDLSNTNIVFTSSLDGATSSGTATSTDTGASTESTSSTAATFTVSATISSNGNATVSARGFKIGTTDVYANATNVPISVGSGASTYTNTKTDAALNTLFYVWAFATNSVGTNIQGPIQVTSPALGLFEVSDWTGSISVNAAGAFTIDAGNSPAVAVAPTSVAANLSTTETVSVTLGQVTGTANTYSSNSNTIRILIKVGISDKICRRLAWICQRNCSTT